MRARAVTLPGLENQPRGDDLRGDHSTAGTRET